MRVRSINAKVRVDNPDLRTLTESVWKCVEQANKPPALFVMKDAIWMLSPVDGDNPATLKRVGVNELRWWLTQNIEFIKSKDSAESPSKPTEVLLKNLLAMPHKCLPRLAGLAATPFFGPTGVLVQKPGYDPQTEILYAPSPGLSLLSIPSEVSEDHLSRARSIIMDELLIDFPFVSEASRAHAIAALLMPLVRLLISGDTPLHLVSKPKSGTGATLLAEIIGIVNGEDPVVITWPNDEGERRRILLSSLMRRPRVVILDNVSDLDSAALSSCLTQKKIQDRIVGTSDIGQGDNQCLWIATGNNPELSDEVARRTVPIRLDAGVESPDQRTEFVHPELKKWVNGNRGKLLWAALVVIKAWVDAGMVPWKEQRLGGFESWSQIMGGILQHCRVPGLLSDTVAFRRKTDRRSADLCRFVHSWWERYLDRRVLSSELAELAFDLLPPDCGNRSAATRVGKLLTRHEDEIVDGFRIIRLGFISGQTYWHLAKV